MLNVSNLSFSFDNGERVIRDMSFAAGKGERLCLSAASGEGKTTVLKLIAGLLTAESGKIEASGKVGMSFQSDALFPWQTALQNVKNVCEEKTAAYWLDAFGLGSDFDKKPDELSGGMRRRVSLARAVAFEPDILLLDEPFNGLDSECKEKIMKLIAGHFSSRLIVFTTHDKSEQDSFATRVIELS